MLTINLSESRNIPVVTVKGRMEAPDAAVLSTRFDTLIGSGTRFVIIDITDVSQFLPVGGDLLLKTARRFRRQDGQAILVSNKTDRALDLLLGIQGGSKELTVFAFKDQAVAKAEALQKQKFASAFGGGRTEPLKSKKEEPAPAELKCPHCKSRVNPGEDRCFYCGMLLSDRDTMLFHQVEYEKCPGCGGEMLKGAPEHLCGWKRPMPVAPMPGGESPATPGPRTPSQADPGTTFFGIPPEDDESSPETSRLEEIVGLKVERGKIEGEIEKLRETETRLRAEVAELEKTAARADEIANETERLAVERDKVFADLAQLRADHEQMKAEIATGERAAQEAYERLSSEADSLRHDIADLGDRKSVIENEIRKADERLAMLRQESAELEAISSEGSRREEALQSLRLIEEEAEAAREVLEIALEQRTNEERELARMRGEKDALERELAALIDQRDAVFGEKQGAERLLDELRDAASEAESTSGTVAALRGELDGLAARKSQLESELTRLESDVEAARQSVYEGAQQQEKEEKALEFKRSQVADLQARINNLEIEYSQSEERGQDAIRRKEAALAELASIQNLIDDATSHHEEQLRVLEETRAAAEGARSEAADLAARRDALEEEASRLAGRLEEAGQLAIDREAAAKELAELESRIAESEAEHGRIRAALAEDRVAAGALRDEVAALIARRDEGTRDEETLRARMAAIEKETAAEIEAQSLSASTEAHRLREELRALEHRRDELAAEVSGMEATSENVRGSLGEIETIQRELAELIERRDHLLTEDRAAAEALRRENEELLARREELRALITEDEAAATAARSSAEDLRRELSELEETRNRTTGELRELKEEIADAELHLTDVDERRALLAGSGTASDAAESGLVAAELSRLREELAQAREEAAEAEARRDSLRSEIIELQGRLSEASEAARSGVGDELAELLRERDELQRRRDALSSEVEEAAARAAEIEETLPVVESLRAEESALRETIASLTTLRDETILQMDEIESRRIASMEACEAAERDAKAVAAEHEAQAEALRSGWNAELEASRAALETSRAELENLRTECSAAEEKHREIEARRESAENELRVLQDSLGGARRDAAELEEEHARRLERVEALRAEEAGLQDRITGLAEHDEAAARSRAELSRLNEEVAAIGQRRDALRAEISAFESRSVLLQGVEARNNELARAIEEKRRELEALKVELATRAAADGMVSEKDLAAARAEIVELKTRIGDEESARRRAEQSMATMRTELEQLSSLVADFERARGNAEEESRLKEQLQMLHAERDQAHLRYDEAMAQLDLLRAEMNRKQTDPGPLGDLEEQTRLLENRIEALRRERDAIQRVRESDVKSMDLIKREIKSYLQERKKISSPEESAIIEEFRRQNELLSQELFHRRESEEVEGAPDAEADRARMAEEMAQLRQALEAARRRNREVEDVLNQERRDIAERTRSLDSEGGEAGETARRELDAVRSENDSLQNQLKQLKHSLDAGRSELEEARGRAEEAERRRAEFQREKESMAMRIADLEERRAKEEDEERSLRSRVEHLERDLVEAREESGRLAETLQEAENENADAFMAERERIAAELRTAQEAEERAVEIAHDLEEEVTQLGQRVKELEKIPEAARSLQSLAEEIARREEMLRTINEQQKNALEQFRREAVDRKNDMATFARIQAEHREKLAAVQREISRSQADHERLAKDHERRREEFERLNHDLARRREELEHLEANVSSLTGRASGGPTVVFEPPSPAGDPESPETRQQDLKASPPPLSAEEMASSPITPREPEDSSMIPLSVGEQASAANSDFKKMAMIQELFEQAYNKEDNGFFQEALDLYEEILRIDPSERTRVRAIHNRAVILARNNRPEAAEGELMQLISTTPDIPKQTRQLLADIRRLRGHEPRVKSWLRDIFGK